MASVHWSAEDKERRLLEESAAQRDVLQTQADDMEKKVPLEQAVFFTLEGIKGTDKEKEGAFESQIIMDLNYDPASMDYDRPPPSPSTSSGSSSSCSSSEDEDDGRDDSQEAAKKIDRFDVNAIEVVDDSTPWKELSTLGKIGRVFALLGGVCFALGLLYIFICSLDLLTSAFQLLAGRVAAEAFTNSVILNNPIAGLMLGILATVLLQSSSTSTSIVVAMVGSNVLTVEQSIYIIMGANIGTSVTNSLVSMSQATDLEVFRRSFAGATVHDMFNWLTVFVLLPIEAATGYLFYLSQAIVNTMDVKESSDFDEPQFLKVITDPLTKRIVQVDKSVVSAIAEETEKEKYPICKYYCTPVYDEFVQTFPCGDVNETYVDTITNDQFTLGMNLTNCTGSSNDSNTFYWTDVNHTASTTCSHLFAGCGVEDTWCNLSDMEVGAILFVCSLFVLLTSVIIMVKILNVVFRGPMAKAIRIGVNAQLPGKAAFLTGYLAILMGAGITMLLQSSSVFTSTLTPLVGMGIISVERMYPLTLGSNIGTTLTSIMAALTASPEAVRNTMQVSMCHLFFNITGILMYYPIPFMRKLPILGAKFLGNTTAKYRWFAIAYIVLLFFVFPVSIFGLSLAGWQVLVGVLVPVLAVVIFIVIIKVMQNYCRLKLPTCLQNWKWLPLACRSLAPYDKAIKAVCFNDTCRKCCKCCKCCRVVDPETASVSSVSSAGSRSRADSCRSVQIIYKDSAQVQDVVMPEMTSGGLVNPAFSHSEIIDEVRL